MEKFVFLSDSDSEHARETGTSSIWYTVIHDGTLHREQAKQNPWNQDESVFEKRCYLMDDCMVSFHPARFEDRIDRQQDRNKRQYFIEISNQDVSSILISRLVYTWNQVIEFASYFKGLSFNTASWVWKSKKL